METYVFDGSFVGLLSAIFAGYERRVGAVKIVDEAHYQPCLLGHETMIHSEEEKALRVWRGMAKHIGDEHVTRFYAAFLAEDHQGYQHLFDLSRYIFDHRGAVIDDFSNPHVLFVSQLARKVYREKHRMEAFVRFQKLADGLFFSPIEPDYNVLPLIRKHFVERYADQRWVIYDIRREYGWYYDGDCVSHVSIQGLSADLLADDELLYQQLWKGYFCHTTIASRKNMKLHTRHIPTRYWRYLTEKT